MDRGCAYCTDEQQAAIGSNSLSYNLKKWYYIKWSKCAAVDWCEVYVVFLETIPLNAIQNAIRLPVGTNKWLPRRTACCKSSFPVMSKGK